MNAQRPSIVVGCDASAESEQALTWASDYARATGGSLTLVCAWDWPVFDGAPVVYGDYDPGRVARTRVESLTARTGLPEDRLSTVVVKGGPDRVLIEEAQDADLLVVGSHGQGALTRLMLGSTSTRCLHHAPCPVAIIRGAAGSEAHRGVVVGVDESAAANDALHWALDYADAIDEPLTVIRCIDEDPPALPIGYTIDTTYPASALEEEKQRWLDDLVDKAAAERGRPVSKETKLLVLHGPATTVLTHWSKQASVVVVGSHGDSGLHRLFAGSVSTGLAHHSESPVVVVR